MKKLIQLFSALKNEIEAAVTPDVKRTICEDAKQLVMLTLTGPWQALALLFIGDIENGIGK